MRAELLAVPTCHCACTGVGWLARGLFCIAEAAPDAALSAGTSHSSSSVSWSPRLPSSVLREDDASPTTTAAAPTGPRTPEQRTTAATGAARRRQATITAS